MAKKQALGRGLGALLPQMDLNVKEQPLNEERVREISITEVFPNPDQPRTVFDEEKLAELTSSIKEHGIMQPLLVMAKGDGYQIIAGERRWRAANQAGLEKVPCIVRSLSPEELAEVSLIENIQREDLTPLEEGEAYRALMDSHGYTQDKLAKRLGKSRPHITNTMRLLDLLPQEKQALMDGRMTAGHARTLLTVSDEMARGRLFAAILKDHLSVRKAEELAKEVKGEKPAKPVKQEEKREKILVKDLEKQLTRALGLKVKLAGDREKGRMTVEYRSGDDLQTILDKIL